VAREGIEISASSPEYGERKKRSRKEYQGEPLDIGINAQYMLDFLGAAAEGPISLELKANKSAGQMRPLPKKPTAIGMSSCPCGFEEPKYQDGMLRPGPNVNVTYFSKQTSCA